MLPKIVGFQEDEALSTLSDIAMYCTAGAGGMALTAQLLLQTCCPSAKRAAPTAAEVGGDATTSVSIY